MNNIRGSVSFKRAFEESNEVLAQSVYAITSILTENSLMNVDFADVRYTLKNKGNALIGFGTGKGNNRAIEAVEAAISSPLVGSSIIGAKNAIVCITGTDKVSLEQINDVIDKIKEAAQGQLDIILGLNDEMNANNLYDSNAEIIVTVVATDFAVRSDEKVEEIQDYKKRIDDLRRIQFFQEESNEASSTSSEDDDSIPSYLKRNI
ncbi:MAG: hypothetical protein LBM99_06385 [Bacillales bacterium]|nr:hypothetical protein [Bacillales bacterium]